MRIGEICSRDVVTCKANSSAFELARLMRDEHVGSVIVVDDSDGQDVPVGIVTDRDLVIQVLATQVEPQAVTAGDMMKPACTVLESEVVYDAIWTMRRAGARRLPVVDGSNSLFGIVSADDLAQFLAAEITELSRISPQQRRIEADRFASSSGR